MNELTLLVEIAVALVAAFFGGLIARRLGLPTIVGYLLAGIAIGPFTPGFVGDTETISQLAELGVIFLMFGVGLEFSIADLWKVRDIAPAALLRMAAIAALGYALGRWWGWTQPSALLLGLALSGASTIVLMRGLMDNSLLNTRHGQAAVGWSVSEDLATVLILVALPTLAQAANGIDWRAVGVTLGKAAAFAVIVALIGTRLIPWVLHVIARTRSRELFILAVLVVSLGTALAAAELFGVSLALGAFVAGVVVSESPLSRQAAADIVPLREAFAVLFFVSIGMLVNPADLLQNIGELLVLLALVVAGKAALTLLLSFTYRRPAYTTLVLAAGTSQVSEFAFILGQAGLALMLLERGQYTLILAVTLLAITINPLLYRLIPHAERSSRRFPALWQRADRHGPAPALPEEALSDHIVIVGYGRVGQHIVDVAKSLGIPHLVIESNFERVGQLNRRGTTTLYGDAANSEVLPHSRLERARALVVTVPDEATAEMVVAAAHDLAPDLPIIVRAATTDGVTRLSKLGAHDVIHPELEGGLEIVRHTLLQLGFPLREVFEYTDAVRQDHYDAQVNSPEEHRLLHDLMRAARGIEVIWFELSPDNLIVGQSLAEANLRARTGASVVAILRGRELMANPKSQTVFLAGDRIGLIGEDAQIEAASALLVPAAGEA